MKQNIQLFVLYVVIQITIAFILKDLITPELLYNYYSNQVSYNRIKAILELQDKLQLINYILIPLAYFIKLGLVSFSLYVGTLFMTSQIEYKKILKVTILYEFVLLIPLVIKIFWFLFVRQEFTLEELQFFSPFSLLSFIGYQNVPTWSIYPLQLINVFELIYWISLAHGLQVILQKSFKESFSLVAASYGTGLLLWVSFITFLTVSVG